MTLPKPSRRQVLILSGTALLAAALPGAWLASRRPRLSDTLLGLLADPDAAAELGALWRADGGRPERPGTPERRLARRLRAQGWRPGLSPEATRDALAASVRADYLAARTASLAGWELSDTEIDLCILAALRLRQQR